MTRASQNLSIDVATSVKNSALKYLSVLPSMMYCMIIILSIYTNQKCLSVCPSRFGRRGGGGVGAVKGDGEGGQVGGGQWGGGDFYDGMAGWTYFS